MRLQFRAEFINAFNQRQWLADPAGQRPRQHLHGLDDRRATSPTDRFGQISATRAAREIQLGLKLYW